MLPFSVILLFQYHEEPDGPQSAGGADFLPRVDRWGGSHAAAGISGDPVLA